MTHSTAEMGAVFILVKKKKKKTQRLQSIYSWSHEKELGVTVPVVSNRTDNPGNSQEKRYSGHGPGQPHLLWLSGVGCQSSLNCQLAVVSGHLRGQGSQLIRTRHRFGYLGSQSTTSLITNTNTCSSHLGISVKITILKTKIAKYITLALFYIKQNTILM